MSYFSLPLYSQVGHNLWMGSTPAHDPKIEYKQFSHIVNLFPVVPYVLLDHQWMISRRMYDALELPDVNVLDDLNDAVNQFRAAGPTLVHCQAGLNRSGLVVAYRLIRDGMAPKDAIETLRRHRSPDVLCNPVFEAWLLSLDP